MCFKAGSLYEQSCPYFCLGVEVQHVYMYVVYICVYICLIVFAWFYLIIHVRMYASKVKGMVEFIEKQLEYV
jgi:hypothetical protein